MNDINSLFFLKSCLSSEKISAERKKLLDTIAEYIATNSIENINFICTHNSRRSQLAQVWAQVAIDYFKLDINVFSSGTEVTAFHKNTVKTLQNSGFVFKIEQFLHTNPKYAIYYGTAKKPIIGFSKLVANASIKTPFVAITTCTHADTNCPFIPDAKARFYLPFVDPKISDAMDSKETEYFKTSKQIATEMAYLFSTVTAL